MKHEERSPVQDHIIEIQNLSADNLSSTYGAKKNFQKPDLKSTSDKNAYMTFLELQLERISQSCAQQ